MQALLRLSDHQLREIASALRSGRLGLSSSELSVRRYISPTVAAEVVSDLRNFSEQSFTSAQVVVLLESILRDRKQRYFAENSFDLVATGPESKGMLIRNTGVVVRELFVKAEHSVLVAGYAVYQGRHIFRALAERMSERPELNVRLFLNVPRVAKESALPMKIVRRFFRHFQDYQWPVGYRLPNIYYYPPSLESDSKKRSCLHAKCVVVDSESVFISSANFTEAAQCRNIEVGLSIRSTQIGRELVTHFDALLHNGVFESLNR